LLLVKNSLYMKQMVFHLQAILYQQQMHWKIYLNITGE